MAYAALMDRGWSVPHIIKHRFGVTCFYRKEDVLLVIGYDSKDGRINQLSWFSNDVPSGETMAAGDRFRRAMEMIHGTQEGGVDNE
ncbi:hypothetical protein [Mycolicibacterium palauense]|uniref:hypothetical protein n=1 Tax=Mycolicibacterium palauense TaxID=2034511 RepID=UPI001C3F2B03|nr:hypothetical protein [Mycolicibacterium palauense]